MKLAYLFSIFYLVALFIIPQDDILRIGIALVLVNFWLGIGMVLKQLEKKSNPYILQ